jgi:diaminopimelate decarboxylase
MACSTPKTSPFRHRAEVGHAVLLLFDGDADPALPRFRRGLCRPRSSDLLRLKANSNQAVLATLARLGAGADVVSEGELRRALAPASRQTRSSSQGSGKDGARDGFALAAGIRCFNVESEPELERLSEIASSRGVEAPISLRINPDVDARTHEKISTGRKENKFGIPFRRAREIYRRAAALPGLRVTGVDMHIGSQITLLEPFDNAFALLSDLVMELRADGHAIEHVDLGGGLGIPYRDDEAAPPLPHRLCGDRPQAHQQDRLRRVLRAGAADRRQCRNPRHPGDLPEGRAGPHLRGRRRGDERPDPATLYDAWHRIGPCGRRRPEILCDVVGPVCETGDYLARARRCRGPKRAICSPSSPPAPMAPSRPGTYNSRLLVPEVMVDGATSRCAAAPELR